MYYIVSRAVVVLLVVIENGFRILKKSHELTFIKKSLNVHFAHW